MESSCPVLLLLVDLPVSLVEGILARLPLRSALAASCTCKHLYSMVSSPPFAFLHGLVPPNRSPWFFLVGINHFLPSKNQAFAFDPLSRSWTRLPFVTPPLHDESSLSGMNGALFAIAGAKQVHLCLSPLPLKQKWEVIAAPMRIPRSAPLVGIVGDPSSPSTHKIVVAGGVDEDSGDHDPLAVEIYERATRQWRQCPPLPQSLCGQATSSAVLGAKFYLADCYSGDVCAFDVQTETWTSARCEKAKGMIFWRLVACEGGAGLLAVALCRSNEGNRVKLLKLDEASMEISKEVGSMPAGLFNDMFRLEGDDEDELQATMLYAASGGGNLLYVYTESKFKDYAACACDLIKNDVCRWSKLPSLPPPVNRFNRVICVSSSIPPSACFPTSLS